MTTADSLRPAVALLAEIVNTFPDLPSPAVVLHQEPELGITVQLQRSCDLEAWREALGIESQWLTLHTYTTAVWIDAAVLIGDVRVQLHSDAPLAPHLAALSPAEDAERRRAAALVEQRHQVEDPAVPPLAFAEPTAASAGAFAVRTLADAQGGAA